MLGLADMSGTWDMHATLYEHVVSTKAKVTTYELLYTHTKHHDHENHSKAIPWEYKSSFAIDGPKV